MFELVCNVTKVTLLAFWCAFVLSLFSLLGQPYSQTILWIGGLLLVVHLAEYLFVRYRVAERNNGNTGFVQTMLFGFAHWLPVLKRPDQTGKAELPHNDA
jgi:uncharacterized protein YhhL (DUF1145 family)